MGNLFSLFAPKIKSKSTIIESIDEDTEVLRSMRNTSPADYMFKVECFSSLKNSLQKDGRSEKIELTEFPACGYTWAMSIYPNGSSKDNSSGHLSFYLKLVDELKDESTVIVTSRFFIYDQIRDKYLTIQDVREKHFHAVKNEWGIPKAISADAFSDPSNGFLMNDSCVFGAEVFVLSKKSKIAMLSLAKDLIPPTTYSWKIERFSCLKDCAYGSPEFKIRGHSWKLKMYPRGAGYQKGKGLSLFLNVENFKFTSGENVYAAFELCLKNSGKGNDIKYSGNRWFAPYAKGGWGFYSFVPLSVLNCPSKGFKVDDVVIVEVKINEVLVLKGT